MTALQMLSSDVRRETVYAHTGWRDVGGRWVYLHAGGAIGADGPSARLRVALPPHLTRGQGNHAGRSRMTAGAEVRPGKPPRGLILFTGEDLPGGSSLWARLWTVEVAARSVHFARLSECQRDAAAGRYAESLAGFVR